MFRKNKIRPIFIHISKNAGTSIVKAARSAIIDAGHRTAASWVAEHGHNTPLFAVIRNPFDRVVSEYCFRKCRYEKGEKNPHLANLHLSFSDWITATYRDGEFLSSAFFEQTGISYNCHNMTDNVLIWFLPQRRWISSLSGEILVDHLLRYENLERDWELFSKKYHINRALGHRNSSRRRLGFQQYYSPHATDIIEDYYKEDLETFGYRFE